MASKSDCRGCGGGNKRVLSIQSHVVSGCKFYVRRAIDGHRSVSVNR
jgi:hypothetical protein